MKQKISIGIILFVCAVTAVVVWTNTRTPLQEEEPQLLELQPQETEETLEVNSTGVVYSYVLKEQDGYVVVYQAGAGEVCMETGILADSLPADVKSELSEGIGILDEAELFDFLESYSS